MMYRRTEQAGFTLIEMIVSVALFATVVTTSLGTLIVLIDANAKAQSIQIAVNNLAFAVDVMSRRIRTATNIYCGNNRNSIAPGAGNIVSGVRDCPGSNSRNAIAFTDTRTGERVAFALDTTGAVDKIVRKVDSPSGSPGSWSDLTGSGVDIIDLAFWVGGTDYSGNGNNSDTEQPSVTVYIEAVIGDEAGLGTRFELQTTVVQRKYDL